MSPVPCTTLRAALLLILLLMVQAAFAADAQECKLDYPPIKGVQVRWQGPCKNGFAHGEGKIEALRERKVVMLYEGMVEQGRPHGQGYLTQQSGTEYKGEFRKGVAHGEGVWVNFKGDRYKGAFKFSKFDGVGSMLYALGGSYDGEWLNNKFHGHGVAVTATGRRIEGEFVDGRAPGQAAASSPPAAPLPDQEPIKEDSPRLGTHIARTIIEAIPLPYDASYEQLTPAQRAMVRGWYHLLDDSDEPPYPLRGMGGIARAVHAVNARKPAEGKLSMIIMVNSEGNATSVDIHLTPDKELSEKAALIAMHEKYKPARCAGKPCSMAYPYLLEFTRTRF
ncbi:MAG TPA: hypothetical protein VF800_06400 [Telluria sp.]